MTTTQRRTKNRKFTPKNPQKYLGNPANIIGRSSWELKLFAWLDQSQNILQWASEEFSITYISPLDNAIHQYYPDVLVIYKDQNDNIKKNLVEIKPYKETVLNPKSTSRDKTAWMLNQAKWKAAASFAKLQGIEFHVLTEKTLFSKMID